MSMIGKSLAHYQITAGIGKGGMGEVYQAKDTKLGRDVAIKVLPEEFARDADRVARFQREAKLLASLNHPNIAAIHGLDEVDGTNFLVMELVEGQTLDERIKAGPLPVEEALKLALQIAEALEAAHEKGVIHRDLKPANIKVTHDSKVKVLDFGLAKAFAGEQADLNLSNSPTLSQAATMQGVILGTAAYMSPEQARGKSVDKRADIWAFGSVLYEMLTGKPAFRGEDVSEILASVIKGDSNLDLLPASIHPRVREVISRCLQKELRRRYPDIGNARYEIERILEDTGGVFVQQSAVESHKRTRSVIPWIAAIVFVGLIAAVTSWYLRVPEPRQVIRFEHQLSPGQQFSVSSIPILAISPDGSHFVYSTNEGLYLRSMDESDASHLTGTDGNSRFPFFSPDGESIGFVSVSETPMKLKKIAIHEGTPMPLCEVDSIAGGFSWSSDNGILYAIDNEIWRTSDNGGQWETLIEEDKGSLLSNPQMLPGGEAVIFVNAGVSPFKIVARSLKSETSEELLEGHSPRYIKTGHIVYGADDNLYVVPFDMDTLKLTGAKTPIIKDVSSSIYHYDYDVSDSGTLVYLPSMFNQRIFTWVDKEGKEEPLAFAPNFYMGLKLSPNGRQVATSYFDNRGNEDIWILDLVSGNFSSRTTDFEGDDWNPIWTSDGKQIIYSSGREYGAGIYRSSANGVGNTERLDSKQDHWLIPWSLSPKGNILAITVVPADQSNSSIGTISLEGNNAVREMPLKDNYHETQPQISPDDKWITYASDRTGKLEVYVRAFSNEDGNITKISNNGGYSPIWSPDGNELFYRTDNTVMAVEVKSGTTFEFETPGSLFPDSYAKANPASGRLWDINPVDNRFLMLKNVVSESDNPIEINIVVNWFEELKGKVPVD